MKNFRRNITGIFSLLIAAMLFFSCSDDTTESTIIPEEPEIVIPIDNTFGVERSQKLDNTLLITQLTQKLEGYAASLQVMI